MSGWQDKSDFEINEAVALTLFEGCIPYFDECECKSMVNLEIPLYDDFEFDPCNNPSDAWSIILENNIIIEPRKNNTSLAYIKGDAQNEDKNPLRAAMIVYLEMNNA